MKIFRVAPIALPIRSDLKYGGIERGVYMLDEEFTRMGLESMVACTADSKVSGVICPTIESSLWVRGIQNDEAELEKHCNKTIDYIKKNKPDIIHDHEAQLITSNAYQSRKEEFDTPILVTLHCTDENAPTKEKLLRLFPITDPKIFFSTVSHYLKRIFPEFDIDYVVHNALQINDYPFESNKGNYLFSLGSITRTKGQDIAIEVARRAGRNLFIAGPKESNEDDRAFWNEQIRPHVNGQYNLGVEEISGFINSMESDGKRGIHYVGILDDAQKQEFFRRARCFLMPIRGSEAFGRVVIESMATGTPVIAFNKASMPEIIQDGKTGFVVNSIDSMTEKIREVGKISPYECRNHVERNFTQERQAREYLKVYEDVTRRYKS